MAGPSDLYEVGVRCERGGGLPRGSAHFVSGSDVPGRVQAGLKCVAPGVDDSTDGVRSAWADWVFFVVFGSSALYVLIWGSGELAVAIQSTAGVSELIAGTMAQVTALTAALVAVLWLVYSARMWVVGLTLLFVSVGSFHIVMLMSGGSQQACGCGWKPESMSSQVFNGASLLKNVVLAVLAVWAGWCQWSFRRQGRSV